MARGRYRKSDITTLCREAGLRVLFASYFTSFGFPLLLVLKAMRPIQRRSSDTKIAAADMRPIPVLLNETMYGTAALEAYAIAHGARIPFGTTLVCVAQASS